MDRKRTRGSTHRVVRQSINLTDNRVGRSQPAALITHTHADVHAVPGPCSQQNSSSMHAGTHTHTRMHPSWEMIYFNEVLDLSCNK